MVVSGKDQSVVGVENSFSAPVTERVIDVSLVPYSSRYIGEPLVPVFVSALVPAVLASNHCIEQRQLGWSGGSSGIKSWGK